MKTELLIRLTGLKLSHAQILKKYEAAHIAYRKRLDEIDAAFLDVNPRYPWGYTWNEVAEIIDSDARAFLLWEVQSFWWQRLENYDNS